MPSRKRAWEEDVVMEEAPVRVEVTMLDRIRSCSEFASFNQYLFIFGKAMKMPDITIEDFEQEFLKPTPSDQIKNIGLALLKNISSHRGLTLDLFDEYTRRQYLAKAPHRNPFGIEEEALKFNEFDFYTKIRVLHQLSLWTFWNPDRMRDKFPDISFDKQAVEWRMEPYGWDAQGRIYYLLDDDRLYRETEAPIPEPVTKKTKTPAKGRRSSKRGRASRIVDSTPEDTEDEVQEDSLVGADGDKNDVAYEEDFEGKMWECVAISFDDFQSLINGFKKTRNADERNICKRLETEIMPFLNKKEEERQRQEMRRLRELENLQKLATAKRSSRLAGKAEQQREQELAEEIERKRREDLRMAQREQEQQKKLEKDRESRMQTREQRLREREVKRILHEEELRKEQEQLAKLAEEEANGGPAGRVAHRQLQAEMAKRQKQLEALQAEEEEWVFDCSICGVHGHNLDDGTHSIACDECNVWQHSACHGIAQEQAELDNFHFVCKDCKRKKENPDPVTKLDFSANGVASVPKADKSIPASTSTPQAVATPQNEKKKRKSIDPSKPRSNVKIIKKKQDKPAGASKQKTLAAAVGVVNGSAIKTEQKPTLQASSVQNAPLVYPGPPPSAPNVPLSGQAELQRFIHYQPGQSPGGTNGSKPSVKSAPHQFQRPAYPSFPPPTAQLQWQGQNGNHPHAQGGSPVKSNGPSSSPISHPSTPSQGDVQRQAQPVLASAPLSHPQPHSSQLISSRRPPQTPGYAASLNQSLSSPAQHLVAPSPTAHAPPLGASESSNHGSSPGYSPKKHPSPPRPSTNAQVFNSRDSHIKPPIALSPMNRPNITSPPVKKSPPPHPSRPDAMNVANLVHDQHAPAPAQPSVIKNATPNGEASH